MWKPKINTKFYVLITFYIFSFTDDTVLKLKIYLNAIR